MLTKRESDLIEFLKLNEGCSSKEMFVGIASEVSFATFKRMLTNLISKNYIETTGKGKATRYYISSAYQLVKPIDLEHYYKEEIDERKIRETFNFEIISSLLTKHRVFNSAELAKLTKLQQKYTSKIAELSDFEFNKELERLAIDLSWKSSQIEGNTYSLLETERLLKEKETAAGKTKEEAIMLLNHKTGLDFIIENPDFIHPISVAKIENIHHLLTNELGVKRNIRRSRVGISGTNYRPLDNEFQILEALQSTCELINEKENTFEKALLSLVLISYIQPFVDGNKRTARIVSNALLMNGNCCALSFRTVDSIVYKKAMLLFYEQNNISSVKNIFIDQYEFAVNTYF